MLDHFLRYQVGLHINHIYPDRENRLCACGCGLALSPRKRRWATKECESAALENFLVIKGDTRVIRDALARRDKGFCRGCGVETRHWHADHILPVHKGGGGCGLDNFQTLCEDCHREKTKIDLSHA